YDNEGRITSILTVARDITERRLCEQRIMHMIHHDQLTGLPNRVFAGISMEELIDRARRDEGKVALVFCDLDNFRAVNDTLGHACGDILLNAIAMRLKKTCLRSSATFCRHGGDEFLLILDGPVVRDDILRTITDIRKGLEMPFDINNQPVNISMSFGIAVFPEDGDNFETLLTKADTAKCRAKEFGRDTHCFYADKMNRRMNTSLHILTDLKQAMVANELQLYYQPLIDAKTGAITGTEALLRWEHPRKGIIPPLQFIPTAESSGLIIPIGKWIIEQACRQAAEWHKQGMTLRVAVNISPMQFKRGDLVETIRLALEASRLEARYLELELTESVIMHDTEETLKMVRQLKRLGVRLAIDDFGTGYSSLAYLKRFAVDKLKIDRCFVRDITHNADDAAIVRAIIQMAKSLGIVTVAEGVEDRETLVLLKDLGCDIVQGFLFSMALNAADFAIFCEKHSATFMVG
ncbi:MAG: EAL domain-containing protein, partial [Deltaproteobacteria bacterium]|nr:EAL domain-containing protein [Candidatus Anaeroferrophillacea bacterium]